ncbi:hypothetical protein [Saccharothrix sp. HUAS TT1]|uniref:hypothetical protein n=1 Tax=unclassified Saccharothrix TaxID=2593673 RepID=UPI00345B6960
MLTGFGLVAICTARLTGWSIDRFGARRCVLTGAAVGGVLPAGVGLLQSAVVAGLLRAAGAFSQAVVVGLIALAPASDDGNRGSSVAVVRSLRFPGASASPAAFVPLYHLDPVTAFLVPAGLVFAVPPVLLAPARRPPGTARPGC